MLPLASEPGRAAARLRWHKHREADLEQRGFRVKAKVPKTVLRWRLGHGGDWPVHLARPSCVFGCQPVRSELADASCHYG